jgi:ribosomal protein S18 acetylase RimI-like enzyme
LNQSIQISVATKTDADSIVKFYSELSNTSKEKFAPHDFTFEYLSDHILDNSNYVTIIAKNSITKEVIGYAVSQLWIFDYDIIRWKNYGVLIDHTEKNYACFAPSVLDNFQHLGIGSMLLSETKEILSRLNFVNLILWGGVKCYNIAAVKFYLKNDFMLMGHFDYNGGNYDMCLKINA